MGASRLSKWLVTEGLVSEADKLTMMKLGGHAPFAFARSVLSLGLLDDEDLASFVASFGDVPRVKRDLVKQVDQKALSIIDHQLISKLEFLPLSLEEEVLTVAVIDPFDKGTMRQISFFTGYKVKAQVASREELIEALIQLIPGFKPRLSSFDKFLKVHAKHAALRLAPSSLGADGDKASVESRSNAGSTPKNGRAEPIVKGVVFENMGGGDDSEVLETISRLPGLSGDEAKTKEPQKQSPVGDVAPIEIEEDPTLDLPLDVETPELTDLDLSSEAPSVEDPGISSPTSSLDDLDLDGLEAALDVDSSLEADLRDAGTAGEIEEVALEPEANIQVPDMAGPSEKILAEQMPTDFAPADEMSFELREIADSAHNVEPELMDISSPEDIDLQDLDLSPKAPVKKLQRLLSLIQKLILPKQASRI